MPCDLRSIVAGECKEVIDVVFVLDTSSSMDFVLTKLESQIADVVAASNMVAADSSLVSTKSIELDVSSTKKCLPQVCTRAPTRVLVP